MDLLEAVAFVLALAMVGCNIREIHWGWPLAIAAATDAATASVLIVCDLFMMSIS